MEVGIIGAGNVGGALAQALSRAGHSVTISSRTQEKAEAVARESGARPAQSNRDAVERAEVVVLAVPYPTLDEVVQELGGSLDGKVVVDPMNRFNPSDPAATIDGTSATEQLQQRLPGARVVKAFNYLFASRMADPTADGIELDAYIAGEDEEAKKQVATLTRTIGLRPIDVGGLGMSRALEALATLNIVVNIQNDWPWQSSWKLVGPTDPADQAA